jgi:polysaccharide export outer membrane protein
VAEHKPFSLPDNGLRAQFRAHIYCLHVANVSRRVNGLEEAGSMTARVGKALNIVAMASVTLLMACGGSRKAPELAAVRQAAAPSAAAVDTAKRSLLSRVADSDRTIIPRDLVDVTVFDAPDLSRVVRVADDGMISLPLLGPVQAAGRTPRALEAALQDTLRRTYMRDPRVSVTVREPAPQPVYVVGEVNQPGAYSPSGEEQLTVLRAVAVARGAKPSAQGRAFVLRPQPTGEPLRIRVNINDMVQGKSPDLVLIPNDVVYVPKSTERAIALGTVDALVRIVTFGTVRKF